MDLHALFQNPVIIGIIMVVVMVIAEIIVKRTKTTVDDKVYGMIVHAFNLAEKIPITAAAPAWVQKISKALDVFSTEYKKREGKEPTEDLIQLAKDEWSILANELKKKES